MGLSGIFRFFLHRTLELLVIVLLVLFLPYIPPNVNIAKPFKVAPARPFEGKLALNERLNSVEIWHKGNMIGPEAFADYQGELFTTVHGGDIVKLVGDHVSPVVRFGKPCKGVYQEHICGRPLGMVFDRTGALYVADAYSGVYKVDVKTGKKERLIAVNEVLDGKNVTLPNSVAVAGNGDIYWTDSSSEFKLSDGLFDMFADGSGRLVHYNANTKKNTVLIRDLHFANGVLLSKDEDFVLVAETGMNRILRKYLTGPKRGIQDIFIDGLPGLPDNLKSDGKGGVLVTMVIAVDAEHPLVTQIIGPFPLVRRFIARCLGLIQVSFKLLNDIYPNVFAEKGVHFIGSFTMTGFLFPKRTTIIHLSPSGEILDSIHTFNPKISGISDAHIFKDALYLGSPFNDYIGRIPLSAVGWDHLKQVKPAPTTTTTPRPTTTTTTTPRPTTTTPKPTTTTPKPTTTTAKPTTPKPATTTQRPTATTSKPTQAPPKPTQAPTPKQTPPPVQQKAAPSPKPVKEQPRAVPAKEL